MIVTGFSSTVLIFRLSAVMNAKKMNSSNKAIDYEENLTDNNGTSCVYDEPLMASTLSGKSYVRQDNSSLSSIMNAVTDTVGSVLASVFDSARDILFRTQVICAEN